MTMPGTRSLTMPHMDPALGRKLFASKGCVACHAINGVGGHDAVALDAHTLQPMMHHQHGDPGAVMEHAEELGHMHGVDDEHHDE